MTIYGTDRRARVGDGVSLNVALTGVERYNSGRRDDLAAGTQFRITRLFSGTVIVRTVDRVYNDYTRTWGQRSYTISGTVLDFNDNVRPGATRRTSRRLGTKPDDTDAQQFIGIDHPGIQWIWEDLATYANRQHWCRQYDELAAAVGIPGRPQDFTVSQMHNGISVQTTIRARSREEAQRRLNESLNPPQPEPEPTPSESEPQVA